MIVSVLCVIRMYARPYAQTAFLLMLNVYFFEEAPAFAGLCALFVSVLL